MRFCVELADEARKRDDDNAFKPMTIAEIADWLRTLVVPSESPRPEPCGARPTPRSRTIDVLD